MSFQFNDAQAIQAGMALVPNLRDQLMEDALMKLRQQEARTQQQVVDLKQREMDASQVRLVEYQRDLEAALLEGTPAAIRRLQTKYPEITKDAKESFDAMDEDMRQTTLTEMGAVWERVRGKDFAGAAAKLEQRIAADRAAGEDTAEDEEILAMLRSNDPQQQGIASGMIAYSLRAIAGDKFDALTKAIDPVEATSPTMREYRERVQQFGQAAADAWLRTQDTKTVAVNPGGTVFQLGGDTVPMGSAPAAQGGGDPSGSGALGLTPEQFRANAEALGPARAAAMTARNGIPVRVRSVQEANALPPGTLYATPTGELYTR